MIKDKKLKVLSLTFFLLFYTGCKANYELDLTQKRYQEKLTFHTNNQSSEYQENINNFFNKGLYHMYEDNFNESNIEERSKYIINKNNESVEIIGESNIFIIKNTAIIRSCFTKLDIITKNNLTTFNTSSDFKCFDEFKGLNEVDIKIYSNKFSNSNADVKEKDYHIWKLNKENIEDKNINFSIGDLPIIEDKKIKKNPISIEDEKSSSEQIDNVKEKSNNNITLLIIGLILTGITIIGIFLFIKQTKSNKI